MPASKPLKTEQEMLGMSSKLKTNIPGDTPVVTQARWGEGSLRLSSHRDAGGMLRSSSLRVTGSHCIQLHL